MTDLDTKIGALAAMDLAELQALWPRLHGAAAPRLSPELMRLALAYRLQERAHGGLTGKTARRLRTLQETLRTGGTVAVETGVRLKPGATLVREWHGRTHAVTVVEDGFRYRDQRYRSLSAIAREITGARWSGPRFFGLRRETGSRDDDHG